MPISCNCVIGDVMLTCKSFQSRQSRPNSRSSSTSRRRRSRCCFRIARALPWSWDCCDFYIDLLGSKYRADSLVRGH